MKKQTLGMMISSLRKEKGMTQLELAEKMGVTDKAVSKWERDLSFPDINSIPKLAETLDVAVDDLMQVKAESKENMSKNKVDEIVDTALKGIGIAMGIAVTVLSVLEVRKMKNYRMISKVILTICLCGIVLAVINGFTGIINNSIQISGTIICISAFVVASVTIILLENGRIKK